MVKTLVNCILHITTFIFDRCLRSSAAMTPVKYQRENIIPPNRRCVKLKIPMTEWRFLVPPRVLYRPLPQCVNSIPLYLRKFHFMCELVRTSSKYHWSIYRTSGKLTMSPNCGILVLLVYGMLDLHLILILLMYIPPECYRLYNFHLSNSFWDF